MKRKPPKFILLDTINCEIHIRQDIPNSTLEEMQEKLSNLVAATEAMAILSTAKHMPYVKIKVSINERTTTTR